MSYFNLPLTTNVNRFIPKNAFDTVTNSKQKKKFAEVIDKISWLNKISKETVNLTGTEIQEIQIFEVKLKEKIYPKALLDIIDKSIPYPIVFVLEFQDEILISTSKKHNHLLNQDKAVLDWSFSSSWFTVSKSTYQFNLKISLDYVYNLLCAQLSNYPNLNLEINEIIEFDKNKKTLQKQISELENAIKVEKQFNKRVELNIALKHLANQYLKFKK